MLTTIHGIPLLWSTFIALWSQLHSYYRTEPRCGTLFRSWVHSVPHRSRIIAAGDINVDGPYIGPGLTPHRTAAHRDQAQCQARVTHSNFLATNTWGRAGTHSATYVNHQDAPVQIDDVFLRLTCNVPALRTRILRSAPVVSLGGMRHFPITLDVPRPTIPKHKQSINSRTAAAALRFLKSEEDRLRFERAACTLLQLPIKQDHVYLGVKIGYRQFEPFERSTIAYRIQPSWAAFYRLYPILTSKALSLPIRLRVWRTCVRTVLLYGLASMQIGVHSPPKLRKHAVEQLRSISRSPAHITHEPNEALLTRLQEPKTIVYISQTGNRRIHFASDAVGELQPAKVHQCWNHLRDRFSKRAAASQPTTAGLTEVTRILRSCTTFCPICGLYYPSLFFVRTRIGKSRAEASTAYTKG